MVCAWQRIHLWKDQACQEGGPTDTEFSNPLREINLVPKLQSSLTEIWGRNH